MADALHSMKWQAVRALAARKTNQQQMQRVHLQ
jgi:hypothetical protein